MAFRDRILGLDILNLPSDICQALETPERPISTEEFREFWQSLTENEKNYYRYTDLSKI